MNITDHHERGLFTHTEYCEPFSDAGLTVTFEPDALYGQDSPLASDNDQVQDIQIVALGPQDWRDLRAIRLEALQSEPTAYSSSYEEVLAWPDERWRQRLANDRIVYLLARDQGRPIGMVGGYLGSDEGDNNLAVVISMYVTEAQRGRGIGRLLLTTLVNRLSLLPQITTIRLWVTETQEPARRLYEAVGFQVVSNLEGEMIMELRLR